MEEIIILGHENPDVDSIVSGYLLEKILKAKGFNVKFVIPDDKIGQENLDICRKYGLDPMRFQENIDLADKDAKYILVDGHVRHLGGSIVGIIDHHPNAITVKDVKIIDRTHYYNDKVSSTALYICQGNEDLLEPEDLKLAIIATFVDTASLNSTKAKNNKEKDTKWARSLCTTYNFDYDELYIDGLCLTDLSNIQECSLNGIKKYLYGGKKLESSYIQVGDPIAEQELINEILNILSERVKREGLDAFVFIVHDMTQFKTSYYLISGEKIEKRDYEEYTERGNVIMPEVKEKLASVSPKKLVRNLLD